MAKVAIIFVAVLAFQVVWAYNQEQRHREVEELMQQVQSVGDEAASSVQNAQVENAVHSQILISQSNELAHDVHAAAYHLQQAIDHNRGGQGQVILHEVVRSLSHIMHNIQQALHNEPGQLRAQLKSQVESLVTEAQRLGPVAEQAQHSQHINDEVEDVLDDLIAALHQIVVRNRLAGLNQEQLNSEIQAVTKQATDVIESVSSDNESTIHDLARHAHHLAFHLNPIIHNLQRKIHNHASKVRNVVQQVVRKLSQIRTSLDHAGFNKGGNQVEILKNLLKNNVNSIAVQIEKLVQVAYSSIANEREAENLRNVVHGILARSLVALRQLQRDLEIIVQNTQYN